MRTTSIIVLGLLLASCTCQRLARVDWESKSAHRHCRAAIAARGKCPPPPCHALHMCANEADLDAGEQAQLLDMIRHVKGCEEP